MSKIIDIHVLRVRFCDPVFVSLLVIKKRLVLPNMKCVLFDLDVSLVSFLPPVASGTNLL